MLKIAVLPVYFLRLAAQSAVLAVGQIWANKTRAALTTIGIVIGVASVTTVVAALTGMRSNVLTEFETFGIKKIYVWAKWPDEGPMRSASPYAIRFTPELFDGLELHCPSVAMHTFEAGRREAVRLGDRSEENVQVLAVDRTWLQIENRAVEIGRPFTAIDERQGRPVCLLTPSLRDKLHLDRDCVGQTVLVGDRLFTVVGVVEDPPALQMTGGEGTKEQVLIPFNTAWRASQPWFTLVAASKSPELAEEAAAEIRFYLRRARNLRPGDPDTFDMVIMERFLQQFNQVAVAITLMAGGVVGISLVVGGVGIMNIMLVSVSERTREIGLRKAVGARPSAILLQFLVEAVILCLAGGLVGLAIGQALTAAMAGIPKAQLDKAYIPLWAVAMSFGFAAAVGIFFGMFPAVKAARLDPMEALRHE